MPCEENKCMKKLIFSLLAVMLLASPVMASECPYGQHFSQTGEECTEWSVPVCTHYHWEWRGWHLVKVCQTWSESVCLNTAPVGVCVINEVGNKPTCPSNATYEGTWDGEQWVGVCKLKPGLSYLQIVPRVDNRPLQVNGRNVSFLASKFSTGGILLRPANEAIDTFAINDYSGINTFQLPKLGLGALSAMDYFGATNYWGYKYFITDNTVATYHTYTIPSNIPAGQYKARPVFFMPNSNAPIFGVEEIITIK
jgi:hypothetical protein